MREFFTYMQGARRRLDREQRERAWLAHTQASLVRIDLKKFPKLDDLTKPAEPVRRKTPAEMLEIAKKWDARINREGTLGWQAAR